VCGGRGVALRLLGAEEGSVFTARGREWPPTGPIGSWRLFCADLPASSTDRRKTATAAHFPKVAAAKVLRATFARGCHHLREIYGDVRLRPSGHVLGCRRL
jgi:hypothetical protein